MVIKIDKDENKDIKDNIVDILEKGQNNGNAIRFEFQNDQVSIAITVQSEVESLETVDNILWSYIGDICELYPSHEKKEDDINYR